MTGADASARRDPADARWALLEPLLPAPPVRGGPRRYPLRAMIDAVRWRTRVGAPWRDVPARYGPWWRARALYRARRLNGVRERIEAAPVARADAAGRIDWRVSVDMRRRARPRSARAGTRGDGVERGLGRLKHDRGPTTGYDRLAVRYRTTTRIAAIDHWLKNDLRNTL